MKARVKKFVSPLMDSGTILIRKGRFGIIEGHETRQYISNIRNGIKYLTPNFYPWTHIKNMKDYFEIIK